MYQLLLKMDIFLEMSFPSINVDFGSYAQIL